jgi:ABC-type Na+ efflux pump permease subunit
MKRAALVFGIVSLLLFADGGYLLATHNQVGGDTGTLFGNPNYYLSAGTVVVISAFLLFVAGVTMWLVAVHREDKEKERRPPGEPPTREQPGPSGRTASQA